MRWLNLAWTLLVLLCLGFAAVVAACWAPDRQLGELIAKWAPPPSRFVELDGMQVHIRDTGPRHDPEPIILLHGMASSLHTFEGWQAKLAGQRRVISLDLPGFGLTGPSPQGDYRIETYTRFMLMLLDHLHIDKAVLAGNALGGEIAWQTALLAPKRVSKLILIASDGYQPAVLSMPIGFQIARTPGLRWVAERIMPRAMMTSSLHSVFGKDEWVTPAIVDRYFELNLRVGNRRALFQRMDQGEFGENAGRIPHITQPTLVLWGDADEMIEPKLGARFCQDIRQCRLVTFPGLGHIPQEEDPAQTLKPVEAFLAY